MSLYSVGIFVLGNYVNPSKYLDDINFLITGFVDDCSNGDYPTLRLTSASTYGIDFTGELGIISDDNSETDLISKDRVGLNNLSKEDFDMYCNKILSVDHLRFKSKYDFIGLHSPETNMIFTGPYWEDLDITVIFNYMFKRPKLNSNYDLVIVVDNPPSNMPNTESIIEQLLKLSTGEVYLYSNKSKESMKFLEEYDNVTLDTLQQ